jgi:hypothetical protein
MGITMSFTNIKSFIFKKESINLLMIHQQVFLIDGCKINTLITAEQGAVHKMRLNMKIFFQILAALLFCYFY